MNTLGGLLECCSHRSCLVPVCTWCHISCVLSGQHAPHTLESDLRLARPVDGVSTCEAVWTAKYPLRIQTYFYKCIMRDGRGQMLTVVALLAGALGRDMAQAPAGQSKPIADLLFILSADMVSHILISSCTSWPRLFHVQCTKSSACITSASELSASAQATFTDANALILANVSSTAQYYRKGQPRTCCSRIYGSPSTQETAFADTMATLYGC